MLYVWRSSFCANIGNLRSYVSLLQVCKFSFMSKMLTERWWSSRWLNYNPLWEARVHLVSGLKNALSFGCKICCLTERKLICPNCHNPQSALVWIHRISLSGKSLYCRKENACCHTWDIEWKLWIRQSSTECLWGYWELVHLSWIQPWHSFLQSHLLPSEVLANSQTVTLRAHKELPSL